MVIGVVGIKGGICKSLIAAHMACFIHEEGSRVAAVDLDPQQTLYKWVKRAQPEVRTEVVNPRGEDVRGELTELIGSMKGEYDWIICDAPAVITEANRAIMAVSNAVIVPTGPGLGDIEVAQKVCKMALQEAAARNGGDIAGAVVLTRVVQNSRSYREALGMGADMGMSMKKTAIAFRLPYQDSVGQGTVVWRMGREAKLAAVEMKTLMKEIFYGDANEDETGGSPGEDEGSGAPGTGDGSGGGEAVAAA